MINLVYFGSPAFSAEILESMIQDLKSNISVVGVVTNPDKPTGRQQLLTPSSVAQIAATYHLPTFKPTKLDDQNLAHLKLLKPDIFLVVAYGQIIPDSWLNAPKIKSLNLHFSLLPKYRGALCIQEALKNGDDQTGVTLMEMTSKLDAGPIISQQLVYIDLSDNAVTLQTKLTQAAKEFIANNLPEYLQGKLIPQPQDESAASYTPSLKTLNHQSAYIPWEQIKQATEGSVPSVPVHNLIRSLNPEPGAWTQIKGQEIKILQTHLDGHKLVIDSVQKPGKSAVSWPNFLAGHSVL